ncbi:MAG: alpha/beta fold hydrolase [Gemmatimonadaceae bacterium]|nr:alpha/beta fold hydrolase [Gemmatimonadaceae bacterium]
MAEGRRAFKPMAAGRLAATALVLAAAASGDERVAGHWEGEVQIPGQPLVVKVDLESGGGLWSGSIDIPAQGAAGLSLEAIEVSADASQVTFSIRGVPGNPTFRGTLDGGVISGRFSQGPAAFGFRLSREAAAEPARPQEPRPPYPYKTEEISFQNGPVTLAGTLTLPPGEGPFPAVLLISGSGLQDRDQTVFGHRPFLVWADHLTRAGLAVLRVDDAGAGGSTPHPQPPTTADFAGDAAAAVDFLGRDERIGPVGLMGHSEGGAIAAIVASQREDVAFVVLLAGPGVPGAELLRRQNERLFEAAGMPVGHRQALLALLDRLFPALASDRDEADLRPEVEEIVRRQFEMNGVPAAQQDDSQVQAAVDQALDPWMRWFLAFDPRPALGAVRAPVLALNGELDLQVDGQQNLTAIATALEAGGNRDVTVRSLPGHNHLFQRASTGRIDEYSAIEETLSPLVLDEVRDWILTVTGE